MLFESNRVYTPKEIREILRIPENKFNELAKDGVIPLFQLSTHIRRGHGETLNKKFG